MDELNTLAENISILEKDTFHWNGTESDLIVKSGDISFKTHKNVLKSCPYFAAIINGEWQESHTSEIVLQGYSAKSVQFVLEHLYLPKTTVELDHDLVEIMAITDMLGLSTLMNTLCTTMSTNLCHNFHKPCQDCIGGVITTLQLTNTYNQIELRRKCMEWLSKYYSKTWNSRSFAMLHSSLQNESYEAVKNSMMARKTLTLAVECQRIRDTLPRVKWILPVDTLVKQLADDCMAYLQQHFDEILQSPQFDSLKKVRNAWDLSRIETILLEAAAELPVEQCCLSYLFLENFSTALSKLHKDDQPDSVYLELVSKLQQAVRSRLILRVAMATKCNAWKSLPNEMQTNIMQLGFFNPLETRKAKTELGIPRSQVKVTRCQSMLSHSATNSRGHQRTTNLTRTGSSLHPRATTTQNQTSQVGNVAALPETSRPTPRIRSQNATRTHSLNLHQRRQPNNIPNAQSAIPVLRFQRVVPTSSRNSQSTSENTP